MISPYGTLNFGANLGYTMGGKETVIFGSEEALVTKIFPDMLTEGAYPQAEGGALVTENAREMMGLHIGDEVTLNTPDGTSLHYQITGFLGNLFLPWYSPDWRQNSKYHRGKSPQCRAGPLSAPHSLGL